MARKRRLPMPWLKNLKPGSEEYKAVKQTVESSFTVLDRLNSIVEERFSEIQRQEASEEPYKSSDWASLQAHRNGRKEELLFIKELLSFIYKED